MLLCPSDPQHKGKWWDAPWNTVAGCTKVGPGCLNCYACNLAATRLRHLRLYRGKAYVRTAGDTQWRGGVEFNYDRIHEPLRWRRPRVVFVNDMGDTFHERVPESAIAVMFETMQMCPRHTFVVLTKRVVRMAHVLTTNGLPVFRRWRAAPLENVILGTSVSDQATWDFNVAQLLAIPAATRMVSIEPLLGHIDIYPSCDGLTGWQGTKPDLVIIGCESGHRRRECKLEWVESITGSCKWEGIWVWIKQLSIDGRAEHDMNKWPEHLRLRQWPKGGQDVI